MELHDRTPAKPVAFRDDVRFSEPVVGGKGNIDSLARIRFLMSDFDDAEIRLGEFNADLLAAFPDSRLPNRLSFFEMTTEQAVLSVLETGTTSAEQGYRIRTNQEYVRDDGIFHPLVVDCDT